MALSTKINEALKDAMKAKDQGALRGLRAIKAALLLLQTESSNKEITEEQEIKLLQRLVKQRKESIETFLSQNRDDLANAEQEELEIIQKYLPEQMSEDELKAQLKGIIEEVGAESMKDIGKIMPVAMKRFSGKADGKTISNIIKEIMS